jgi:hypothetical protein
LKAIIDSGIRAIFCYCPIARWDSLDPLKPAGDLMPSWLMPQFEELAKAQPYGGGRVQVGFAFDMNFLPKDVLAGIFAKVRALGSKLITTHYVGGPTWGGEDCYPIYVGGCSFP